MRAFHESISRVLLQAPHTRKSIANRLNRALHWRVPTPLLNRFAAAVCQDIRKSTQPITLISLLNIIQQSLLTDILLSEYLTRSNLGLRYQRLDESGVTSTHTSESGLSLHSCDLPRFENTPALAEWLQVSLKDLDWLSGRITRRNSPDSRYRVRWEPQKNGKVRLLEVPCRRLKNIQRTLLTHLLNRIPPHPTTVGFRKGYSISDYVKPHVAQTIVWRTDLAHFFLSISRARVFGLMKLVGYSPEVAGMLANLMTNLVPQHALETQRDTLSRDLFAELHTRLSNRHLPQGAPTSPTLANLITFKLDTRLSGLARAFGARYSRYADDLAFSGPLAFKKQLGRFRQYALAIILSEGFSIRQRKSVVMAQSSQQQLAGIIVNDRPNVPRQEYKQLRAILHNCVVQGPRSQNIAGHPDFCAHLRGKIAYVNQFNPNRGQTLKNLFQQIDWEK